MVTPSQQGLGLTGSRPVWIGRDDIMSHSAAYSQCIKNPTLTLRINGLLSRCAELSMDVLDSETDMVVRCEPGASDLDDLQEQQDKLELEQQMIREEVEEMERLTSDLQAVSPEEAGVVAEDVQAMLQAWEELGWTMTDNHASLQHFQEMQAFLKTYLAMISWAEETRGCIFSEISTKRSGGLKSAAFSELDGRIQQKLEDFDELVETGQKLLKDRLHLAEIIKERTDELQSMLGWILVHWKRETDSTHKVVSGRHQSESQPHSAQSADLTGSLLSGQEVAGMKLQGPREPPVQRDNSCQREKTNKTALNLHRGSSDETGPSPGVVLEEPSAMVTPIGGSISVLLTFDQEPPGGGHCHGSTGQQETPEPLHRVSTYLQVTDGNRESPIYKDPDSESKPGVTLQSTIPPTTSTTATFLPKVSTVVLPTVPASSSTSSLRVEPTSRRRRAVHRHTVTGLTAVDRTESGGTGSRGAARRANTWPMEEKTRGQIAPGSRGNTELQLYVKNNSVVPVAQDMTPKVPTMQGDYIKTDETTGDREKTHYSIPLGSTLCLDLPVNWDDIPHIRAKGLTIATNPLEKTGLSASPNPLLSNRHRPPGHDEQANISSKVPRKIFAVDSERGGSGNEGVKLQDFSSVSVSVLCSVPLEEDDNSRCKQTESIILEDSSALQQRAATGSSNTTGYHKEAIDTFSTPEGISNVHKQSSDTHRCPLTAPESTEQFPKPHKCLSVHTKICDLKGHIYYSPHQQPFTGQTTDITQQLMRLSTVTANSLTPPACRSDRVVACSEEDCTLCRSVPHSGLAEKDSDLLRPDHWQFEEVEDELEDIWNSVDRERAP
ncbi:uncharacterized protein ACJ7VT_018153 [Polymixia lowei]